MKRPMSTKQKSNGYWGHASRETPEQHHQKNIYVRNKVKIIKPDLTTNDFSRILPRNMYKDKERLYSQGLQLKQAINEISQQNTRLKTQVSMLERQKFRASRLTEPGESSVNKNNRQITSNARLHQRDNKVIRNLKRLLRQYKEENIELSKELRKIRKTLKYIKTNELQIELKIVIEQNERLAQIIEQYAERLSQSEQAEINNQDLQVIIENEYQKNKKLSEENRRLAQEIEDFEEKFRVESEKWRLKQNRLIRQLNHEKKKCIETLRHNDDLKRQLLQTVELKQAQNKKRSAKSAQRPMMSNYGSKGLNNSRLSKRSKQEEDKKIKIEEQSIGLKLNIENQNLLKEITTLKQELQRVRLELSREKKGRQSPKNTQKQQVANSNLLNVEGIDKSYLSSNKRVLYEQSEINVDAVYDDDQFEDIAGSPKRMIMCSQTNEEEQLRKLKQEFNDNEGQQELFRKEEVPSSNRSTKKKRDKANVYKPNKAMLSEIRQLLTYRMKSQRYPFSDLQNDIDNSDITEFTYADLTSMLANEPFYLNQKYIETFLKYCYEKESIPSTQVLEHTTLIAKLRKVISPFQLMSEEKQKEMIIRIAQMTSAYPEQLQLAFEDIKNGEETTSKANLIDMFKKLALEQDYIELIVAQLSLCSEDMEHLNYQGFFQRFYIQQGDYEQQEEIQVIGEESEQSLENSSRVKKNTSKGKNSKQSL